jgi:Asp-tRNA(Asn)/Glu-tRNA(Gln) amidotransferase A subunit family amidase
LNAFILHGPEQVLPDAQAADRIREKRAALGPPHGLPLGLEIDTLANNDAVLLSIAHGVERILPEFPAPPIRETG